MNEREKMQAGLYPNNFWTKVPYWVHHTAQVENGAVIGPDTIIWRWTHVRTGAVIGAECVIGQGCFIDSGASVGQGCHIQNGVSVYRGVTLDPNVFVGPNVTFTNDLHPTVPNPDWQITPTVVKAGASIGAGVVILCGVTIGEQAVIGAGALVTEDVPDGETWVSRAAKAEPVSRKIPVAMGSEGKSGPVGPSEVDATDPGTMVRLCNGTSYYAGFLAELVNEHLQAEQCPIGSVGYCDFDGLSITPPAQPPLICLGDDYYRVVQGEQRSDGKFYLTLERV